MTAECSARPLRSSLSSFSAVTVPSAQQAQFTPAPGSDPLHRPLDQILDVNVRDGLVYYRALQSIARRARPVCRVAQCSDGDLRLRGREKQKMAFWVNAYNAFVLQTVVNHYPIRGRAVLSGIEHTADSRRLRSGRSTARPDGRVTLDEIEKTILAGVQRAAACRSRSAVVPSAAAGCAARPTPASALARAARRDSVGVRHEASGCSRSIARRDRYRSPDPELARGGVRRRPMAARRDRRFAARSPIERALIAFITPHLLPLEKEFVAEERVQGHVPGVRLAPERSDGGG